MSQRELGRVEALARVKSKGLRLVDAAGLKHRSAGRRSNRAYAEKFRRKVLRLVGEKYGGPVGERFGPTLAAEHLASEDRLCVDAETLRRWMLREALWSRERRRRRHRRRREPQGALWRTGADGRELSSLAGGARARGLLD